MAGPREGFTLSSANMETITPIPYDILKVLPTPCQFMIPQLVLQLTLPCDPHLCFAHNLS